MAAGGFGPYHRLWSDDATSKRIGVTPTPWAMMPALGFVPCHWWRELWRTPPQQRICRLDFFGKKNRPKTMNMHLTATNPSSPPKNPPPLQNEQSADALSLVFVRLGRHHRRQPPTCNNAMDAVVMVRGGDE